MGLHNKMKTSIAKSFTFEAAHVLPNHTGKCKNLHGHSYRLEVLVEGPVQTTGSEEGMVMDFARLTDVVEREIVIPLDHQYLNDVVAFAPTAELLAEEVFRRLTSAGIPVSRIELWETPKARAVVER